MGVSRLTKIASTVAVCAAAVGTARWSAIQEPSSTEWRARFAQAALKIPFDKDLPPQFDSAVAPAANVPRSLLNMRIAVARTRDSGRTARIDFRITSDSGYPRLGIAPGINYVWKDFVDGHMRLLVIPADLRYATHWLVVQSHTHAPAVRVTRLVIGFDSLTDSVKSTKGGLRMINNSRNLPESPKMKALAFTCTDGCDPDRPLSWCSSRDTALFRIALPAPVETFARYFARNRVAWERR